MNFYYFSENNYEYALHEHASLEVIDIHTCVHAHMHKITRKSEHMKLQQKKRFGNALDTL